MKTGNSIRFLRKMATLVVISAIWLLPHSGSRLSAQTPLAPGDNPDFDGVSYLALQCDPPGDPQNDENPASTDLVGDAVHSVAFFGRDAGYLYFRYRVDVTPSGPSGFDQYAWVALMQVPTGNEFQHQYELALNGVGAPDDFGNSGSLKGDTVEIWANTSAQDVDFTPLFNDPSETRLFAQRFDFSSGATANTTPLARLSPTGDGSAFGGTPDYFVEFAFPISVMISKGIISTAADLDESLFFLATSADANQYNKDHLNCAFLPATNLSVDKTVAPAILPANTTALVTYTIVVTNQGPTVAKGVVISDVALPAYMSNPMVSFTSNDPTVTATVVSVNPLSVKVPKLSIGSNIMLTVTADASPTCNSSSFTNTAGAFATNAVEVTDAAVVQIGSGGAELCDGRDNDCDGLTDEGGNQLCDDLNACNGAEVCLGLSGCQPGQPLNCDDANLCTTDTCDPSAGCTNTPNTLPCSDGSVCTTVDTCSAGQCNGAAPLNCDDGNVCTIDTCESQTGCMNTPGIPGGNVPRTCTGPIASIPTLSEWGIIALVLSLMASAVALLRRRRAVM